MLLISADPQAQQTLLEGASLANVVADAASGPTEAAELARVWDYDVVFVDMTSTAHHRVTLTQALRRRFPLARVVLLDAWQGASDRVEALDAGADETLEKPLDTDELTARMRAMGRDGSEPALPVTVRSELLVPDMLVRPARPRGRPGTRWGPASLGSVAPRGYSQFAKTYP